MTHGRRSQSGTLTLLIALSALAGCKGGGESSSAASAPATTEAPGQSSSADTNRNHAPTISGSAPTTARADAVYSFAPTASDADGDQVTFQIANKPGWATFSTVTGQLSGTPTLAHTGRYSNITITASDGQASAVLPPFSITVADAPNGVETGAATLSWTAPTENTDGSTLTDLAGYIIVYGQTSTTLDQSLRIENPSVDTYVFQDLPVGTYYFSIKAYTQSGAEGELSGTVSKNIG